MHTDRCSRLQWESLSASTALLANRLWALSAQYKDKTETKSTRAQDTDTKGAAFDQERSSALFCRNQQQEQEQEQEQSKSRQQQEDRQEQQSQKPDKNNEYIN